MTDDKQVSAALQRLDDEQYKLGRDTMTTHHELEHSYAKVLTDDGCGEVTIINTKQGNVYAVTLTAHECMQMIAIVAKFMAENMDVTEPEAL